MSKSNKKKFEILLLRVTVSTGIPLWWVQNKKVQELFKFINPTLKLPGFRALGKRILNKKIEKLKNNTEIKLKNNSVGPILAFDGWTNVINQNIIEAVFITP